MDALQLDVATCGIGVEWEGRTFIRVPPADRELIRLRYQGKARADELVRALGTSRRTLFRQLDRIRRRLHDCVNRRVAVTG